MARPTHGHIFHHGLVPSDQLADGTPSVGDAPLWDGASVTWGPAAGGQFALDTTTYSDDGLRFTAATTDYLGAYGGTATDDGSILITVGYVELIALDASVGVGIYVDATNDVAGIYGGALQVDPPIVMMPNLPTSDPATPGQLWLDGTTLRVSV